MSSIKSKVVRNFKMSAPSKRRASSNEEELQPKLSKNDEQAGNLDTFLTWADSNDFNLNVKVK